jgi:acetyl/propionyl-CoA carboxylase alpha subunit
MNTRLQVEHPVTEMITGVDLVAEQIAIAANRPLSFRQPDISAHGHAIEARLYAESPERGFSPNSGKVLMLGYPHEQGVRVDSGIAQGQSITTAFDPMLAKVIVHAPTRDAAVAKAIRAVQNVVLLGCETNAAFLARVLGDAGFRSGEVHTGYLDENPTIASGIDGDPDEVAKLLAVAALVMRPVRDAADAVPALHAAIGDWRN